MGSDYNEESPGRMLENADIRPNASGEAAMSRLKRAINTTVELETGPALTMTLENQIELIAAEKNRAAFIHIYEDLGPTVKGFLIKSGTTAGTAEDILQEVMIRVWRKAAQFDRTRASGKTWIFTITRNQLIDHFRKEKRPEIDPNDPRITPEQDRPADEAISAEQDAISLREALDQLPDEQAVLLRKSYFESKSQSEIAAELDLPLGTVKSRMRLALEKLRHKLRRLN